MKKLNKQQYRTLKDLTKVEETKLTTITIETKCPKKWALVDMETGDVWVHENRVMHYGLSPITLAIRADRPALEMIKRIADDNLIVELSD